MANLQAQVLSVNPAEERQQQHQLDGKTLLHRDEHQDVLEATSTHLRQERMLPR